MTPRLPTAILPLLTLAVTIAAEAQQIPVTDEGVFVIRAGGEVVGREQFTLRSAGGGEVPREITLSLVSNYPPAPPRRTVASFLPRRMTVRMATASGAAAREYPGGSGYLVADDSVFSLYAAALEREPGPVQVFYPRTGERRPATLEDRGTEATTLAGEPRDDLRHLVLRSEATSYHLWYDSQGRLIKVGVPGVGLVAERTIR
jgi:hypothetical protein